MELPDRISVREVGPRDGLQNEDPVPTDAKVALLDRLSATGVQRIADEQAREAETGRLRREYERDIDILRLASELVVDDIVEPEDLRDELVRRFAVARGKDRTPPRRRHGISPA